MDKRLYILLTFLIHATLLQGQGSTALPEQILIRCDKLSLTLEESITAIESQTGYFVSYNTNLIVGSDVIRLSSKELSLQQLAELISIEAGVNYQFELTTKKLILSVERSKRIFGVVRDSESHETLESVSIYTSNNIGTFTNDEGYFHKKIPADTDTIYLSYIGYKTLAIPSNEIDDNRKEYYLTSDNNLPFVIIRDPDPADLIRVPQDDLMNSTAPAARGLGGGDDLIARIRAHSGVSVGSEAESGFTVRGGGPDQNLILIDGLPIYEISHLGGLSSLFLNKTIKNAEFYKAGIPASFGGKLSSVLDIRLKDGNRNFHKRDLSVNLENLSGFIEGPIGKKTSFLFNGRLSLLDLYTGPILNKYFDIVDSDFKYNDMYIKTSHWFSPSNRLSLTVLNANDLIKLQSRGQQSNFSFSEFNRIKWSNRLYALNWNFALTDKIFLHSQIGISQFTSESISANQVQSTEIKSLEIVTASSQKDNSVDLSLDLYSNNLGKFKLGLGGKYHESSPSIIESRTYLQLLDSDQDSTYLSTELFAYLQNRYEILPQLTLNTGVRFNRFSGVGNTFNYLNPRVNIHYHTVKHRLKFGYARMNQFLHLLVNPSSGLPSDLWVPSTASVAPESSDLLSLSYTYNRSANFQLTLGTFYNQFQGLIEYSNPTDLLQAIVPDQAVFNFNTQDINWEERISFGTGLSYGLELELSSRWDNFDFQLAYTLSRSERTFDFPNSGIQNFLYKFDRPHNLSTQLTYQLEPNKSLSIAWVYGDGNLWTLPQDEETTLDGTSIFVANRRNNQRLSAYHHLDVSYSFTQELANQSKLNYTLGIYNIYNRKNPFYSFIKENPITAPTKRSIIEISLFRVFPQINIEYSW